ncbi:TIM barrel protein [Brevibacillus humidisoli]|uniref:TIM barrel protein n=1 Tax=Brevibacillus humidisoli TaxID=2895522 RepID=UPI001E28FCEA|nr:TIM barrel protein [Brevibacillus humidisoli]UFJ39920.1 TIM barrel protein [Brevibacillus humidisoli]
MGKIARSQIVGMNFHYLHYPLEYFLDAMVRYHFEKIELWGAAPHFYVEDDTLGDMRRKKREIDQRGVSVVCFTPEQCMYPINLAAKESHIRERSVRYFRKSLEACVELEAPMMLVTAGWGYRNEPSEEAWERALHSLQQLAVDAEKHGICLVLEPLTRVESNLVCDRATLVKMLTAIDSPAVKGMIDTIPLALAGEQMESYFEQLQDDLAHIHFVDGNPGGHLAWGDGTLPLEQYIHTLTQYGYRGALSLEFTAMQYVVDPDQAIEKSLRHLQPYLA